ncbi:hypothetical protein SADO_06217 [Salinisphaera dokdonensis CL-ES53]|uniref:DUF4238 domain-containing protein n=1 Tax=Salinisphaera dokdonensis CL-ES53 TaxID=1304272 RepID=A0ABV2AYW5_9GAMM
MATNKNQHFVPRCYLKPFTLDENNQSISVFNLDRHRLIEKAAVKHQCSRSYFYGKDPKLEEALQLMERTYAQAIRLIGEEGYSLTEEHDSILKRFWLLQYLRTEAASRRAVEMSSELRSTAGADASFQLEVREAVTIAMQTFAECIDIVSDLRSCLVKNATNVPFVTSDDPAVLANRWFQADSRYRGEAFGLRSAGDIILLPISPRLMFIAYDHNVYSIPKSNSWVRIKNPEEIRMLNQHQYLNCRANIFPSPSLDERTLIKDANEFCGFRVSPRHALHYAVLDQVDGEFKRYRVIESPQSEGHSEAIIHMQTVFPIPNGWPNFIRWKRNGFGMSNGTGIGCVRRDSLTPGDGEDFAKVYARRC